MNFLMKYIGKLLAFVSSLFRAPPMQPWDGRRALIRWDNRDVWTIEESYEGMQVWGDIGSGKSSTIARVTAAAMLRAGYGGLVLTVKPEDTDEWRRNLAENGRMEDALFFGPDGGCFNFLAYELSHGVRLKVGSKNATRILTELVNMAQHDAAGGDPFWKQSAEVLIGHTLDLIVAAGATPSMLLAKEIIQSGPLSRDQAKDVQWQAQSKCWELIEAGRHGHANGSHDFRMAETYWLRDFPVLPDKTRQSIVATFSAGVAHHFCTGLMHQMFGGDTTVSPDDIFRGKIVIVNLPVLDYHAAGRFAAIVWKFCVQLALQRRADRKRPVFLFSDEAHYFVTDYDQLFQTTARSARCATVYLTQNRSNYLAESAGSAGQHRVQSLCACLKTQVLCQCSHEETRRAFSDGIGKHRVTQVSTTSQFGHGKTTHSETEHWVDEYWVSPDAATDLKTGGEANGFEVTAIMTKAGKRFSNGKPGLRLRFDQNNFEPTLRGHTVVAIPMRKRGE